MSRVLIVCNDRVGQTMAGPGIRSWEMARALVAEHHEVRLTTPYPTDREDAGFAISISSEAELSRLERWADVIVVQGFVLTQYPALAATDKHLVVDIYDPFVLETLEMYRAQSLEARRMEHWPILLTTMLQLGLGDFFICANERQRDFWMGALMAADRLNPDTHDQDGLLRRLIDVVPFGSPETPPVHSGRPALRGVLPGFDEGSRIAIWGGGLYNWFDPLSLIGAWPKVLKEVPNARLVFTGTSHPTPITPPSPALAAALRLADELGLRDGVVHFTPGWVPYDRRQDYLLESDIGVTTHHNHLETRLSFRTRYLDYIWAGLPIVGTEGDHFAEWIALHGTGRVVPYDDVDAIASALVELLGDDEKRAQAAAAVRGTRPEFTWSEALKPVVRYCADPWHAADRADRPRAEALRNEVLVRLFSGLDELRPPARGWGKALWYWRREGTLQLARRLAARARRKARIWRAAR